MNHTKFNDTAGLDDVDTFSTANDLTKLAFYISNEHPVVWDILRTQSMDITSSDGSVTHHLKNTNQLLSSRNDIRGGKTGYTSGLQSEDPPSWQNPICRRKPESR